MTLSEIKKQAESNEDYSSVNGWGFGGWVGKIYRYANGCKVHVGKWYYRHQSPSKVESYWNSEGQQITKAEFEKQLKA